MHKKPGDIILRQHGCSAFEAYKSKVGNAPAWSPELYKELPNIISVNKIESAEITDNAKTLNKLLDQYC
ncbi:MAG: hypothetical protein ACRDE8_06065 [Ginsengibacter sp.]